MKQIILPALMVLFTITSFAFTNKPTDRLEQDLETQAFELLVKNVDKIQLDGDIIRGEKLKPILDDLGDFIGEHIFSMFSSDDENYKGSIRTFTAECSYISEHKLNAKCQFIIQYKPLGEVGITYFVGVDSNKKPESILNNRVTISRGD